MNAHIPRARTVKVPPSDPRLTEYLKDYPPSVFSEQLYQSMELLELYSVDTAIDLARRLKVLDHLGDWRSIDDLCGLLSFQPSFKFALRWILERLVEIDCIEARSEGGTRLYHLRQTPRQPDLVNLRAASLEIDPANAATLDLLDHAAGLYPAVANGEQSGDRSLLGPHGMPLWLNYFHNDNSTYAVNNWIGATLAAERVSSCRALRILEVGAGPGSASEILLRLFHERGISSRIERYLITEPNAFFTRCSQRKLKKQYPELPLEWTALNLDLPWSDQGVHMGEFDLVYAVNVMHVSNDLLFSLKQARSALAPHGWLVIGECLRPYPNQPIYPELMFQILESFIKVKMDPEIRPNPGFLTAEQWQLALTRAGFARVEVAPNMDRVREIYPHFFTGAICGQNVMPNK
ncbi:MAG TPA: class I SAM-dependent methyltransferase [Candidatus Udaeobacter sp.]|jgi:SAM-dependent methyltransferase|nr:class I SAM-dependent methyltransferase [Candidatus Udaeobacter sp.]